MNNVCYYYMNSFKTSENKYLCVKKKQFNCLLQDVNKIFKNCEESKENLKSLQHYNCKFKKLINDLKAKNESLLTFKSKFKNDITILKNRNNTLINTSDAIHNSNTSTGQMLDDKNVQYNEELMYKYNLVIGIIIIILMLFN